MSEACSPTGARRSSSILFLERLDFAFAFHDQSQSDSLDATGGKATTHFIPQQGRNLIAN